MNRKQLIVMWVAIGVIGIMCLALPWKYHCSLPSGDQIINRFVTGPYRSVFFGPPNIPVEAYIKNDYGTEPVFKGINTKYWIAEIDLLRLLLPMAVVIVVAGGLIITFRNQNALMRRKSK